MNYPQIDELFGAPLNTVPKPHVPFSYKTWHIATGCILISFTLYGIYKAYERVLTNNLRKNLHEEPKKS